MRSFTIQIIYIFHKTLLKQVRDISFIFTIILGCLFNTMTGQELKDYQWKNRLLIISAESERAEKLKAKYLVDIESLEERKLLLIKAVDGEFRIGNSKDNLRSTEIGEGWLKSISAYEFQIFLVGLDGGVKKIWQTEPAPLEIFDIIDAMPMRLSELKKF